MRKLNVLALMVLVCASAWGQNSFPATGSPVLQQEGSNRTSYDVKNSNGVTTTRLETASDKSGQLWIKNAEGNVKVYLKSNGAPSYFMNSLGIGTTNPLAKLHIKNSDQTYGGILAQANESNFQLYTKTLTTQPINVESFRIGLKYGHDEKNGFISFYRGAGTNGGFLGFSTNGRERLRISNNGNVGIGTNDPKANLHLESQSPILRLGSNAPHEDYRGILGSISFTKHYDLYEVAKIYAKSNHQDYESSDIVIATANNSVLKERVIVKHNGNVGIGTTDPGDYKLAVEGTIGAHEIKVTTDGWADFVFDENYSLPQLEEVEAYIQEHNHLPNIPSEQEVQENGIALGQMDAKLLRKIEELTLYAIQKDKEVMGLNKVLSKEQRAREELEEDMSSIKEELQAIKALIKNNNLK